MASDEIGDGDIGEQARPRRSADARPEGRDRGTEEKDGRDGTMSTDGVLAVVIAAWLSATAVTLYALWRMHRRLET